MTPQNHPALPRSGEIRWSIWLLLIGSLLVALAMPLLTLWHAALSPLTAQVCIWPATSQVPETTRIVVTIPGAADRAAVAGPWAHLHVTWDMVGMPMATHPIDLDGTANQAGTFSVPLHVDMPGPWWVDLVLQTPGRPDWHTLVHFTVASSGNISPVGISSAGAASIDCDTDKHERKSDP
jgi:hypothetical protein